MSGQYQVNLVQPNKFRKIVEAEKKRLEEQLNKEMHQAEVNLETIAAVKNLRERLTGKLEDLESKDKYQQTLGKSADVFKSDAELLGEVDTLRDEFENGKKLLQDTVKEARSKSKKVYGKSHVGSIVDCFVEQLEFTLEDELAKERKQKRQELEERCQDRIATRKMMAYDRIMREIAHSEDSSYFDAKPTNICYMDDSEN